MTPSPPSDPTAYAAWLDELERKSQAGMIPDPQAVAAILVNARGEVLLQQRDETPHIAFAGYWTLPGGVVEGSETPDEAMRRELEEETDLRTALKLWKAYRRRHHARTFNIEQFVYTGQVEVEAEALTLGEGQALRFFGRGQTAGLPIAFGFEALLEEFWENLPAGD